MTRRVLASLVLWTMTIAGCVSAATHRETVAQVAETCQTAAQSAVAFEVFKKEAAAEIQALKQEESRLAKELITARDSVSQTRTDLESTQYHLVTIQQRRREAERQLAKLQSERDILKSRAEVLTARLQTAEQEVSHGRDTQAIAEARIAMLEQERTRLSEELVAMQGSAPGTQRELEETARELAREQQGRREAETELTKLQDTKQQIEWLGTEIRRERDLLKTKVENLSRRLASAWQALSSSTQSLTDAHGRIADLQEEKQRAKAALTKARNQARMLKAALAAEQETWAKLQKALRRVEHPVGPASLAGSADTPRGTTP